MKRHIFIGDIHGCLDELQRLMHAVRLSDSDRLISVGDLVDRGPDNVAVWELFRDRPNSQVLMGNHERKHVRGVLSYSQEIVKLQFGERYAEFREWASTLPYYLETDDVIAVHGGFEDGVPLERQREDVLAATTSGTKFLERKYGAKYWPHVYSGSKPIVFGHHVVGDEAEIYNGKVYGIDTGACHGGYLTALIVPGWEIVRVPAKRDYWRSAQKHWAVPVQRARPWGSYRWSKIERELSELGKSRHANLRSFAQELATWLKHLDELLPALVERVHARHHELRSNLDDEKAFKKRVAADPLAPLLFASHAGSLSAESCKTILANPGNLVDAAGEVGLGRPALGE